VTGSVGATGAQGIQGATGNTGATGVQGVTGPTGATGAQGPTGLTGATGSVGATGIQGLTGATGPQGLPGTNGTNGNNGQNTLVNTTAEPTGTNCATGGVKLEYGLDANNNGTLDAGEINASLTKYICNGNVGATGPQGSVGAGGKRLGKLGTTIYTLPGWNLTALSSVSSEVGRLTYVPIYVDEVRTYIGVATYVSPSTTVLLRTGLYSWNNGLPGSLIFDFGTFNASSTGLQTINFSFTLQPGYYFVATVSNSLTATFNSLGIRYFNANQMPVYAPVNNFPSGSCQPIIGSSTVNTSFVSGGLPSSAVLGSTPNYISQAPGIFFID
jgi:hypothetical protein